jgi:Ca2+-binding EF-hand superfamily protein
MPLAALIRVQASISTGDSRMKTPIIATATAIAALLAGAAVAGDSPRGDAPRQEMRADKDGDGRVSREEATAAGAERSGQWFDKLDADKDGYVTKEEMAKAREDRRAGMRTKMDEHFKAADINSDGQLSLDEVQAKMPRMADRFNDIDKNKDGQLSKDELKRGGHRHKPQG